MEAHSALNNLDYIVLFIVLLSGLLALLRGFVREMFSLVAWIGAYFISSKFYAPAVPLAHHYIRSDKYAEWAAIGGVFVVTLIILLVIGFFISGFVKGRALTSIDRSLGFLYGLARGVLVVSAIYLGAVMIMWPDIDAPPSQQQADKDHVPAPEFLVKAKTRPAVAFCAKVLKDFIPKDMLDKELKSVDSQKQELTNMIRQKGQDAAWEAVEQGGNAAVDVEKLMKQGTAQ